MFDINLLIDDRDPNASDPGLFERYNPLGGELATRAAAATVVNAQAAATAAAAAFRPGRHWVRASAGLAIARGIECSPSQIIVVHDFCWFLVLFSESEEGQLGGQRRATAMNIKDVIVAACLALATPAERESR